MINKSTTKLLLRILAEVALCVLFFFGDIIMNIVFLYSLSDTWGVPISSIVIYNTENNNVVCKCRKNNKIFSIQTKITVPKNAINDI